MTFLLKIIAPIVVLFSAIVQVGLDYYWADRRTNKHRYARIVFFILMIIGGVCSIGVVIIDHQDNNTLIIKLDSLEAKLNPFLELAKARFPALDSGEALKKLSWEIKELEKQTKDLEKESKEEKTKRIAIANQLQASQKEISKLRYASEPRHLTDTQQKAILQYLKSKPRFGVIIAGRLMDYESCEYAKDFAEVLRKVQWDLRVSNSSTNSFKGICVYTNLENSIHPGVEVLSSALKAAGIETVKAQIGSKTIADMPANTLFLVIGSK